MNNNPLFKLFLLGFFLLSFQACNSDENTNPISTDDSSLRENIKENADFLILAQEQYLEIKETNPTLFNAIRKELVENNKNFNFETPSLFTHNQHLLDRIEILKKYFPDLENECNKHLHINSLSKINEDGETYRCTICGFMIYDTARPEYKCPVCGHVKWEEYEYSEPY